MILFKFGSEISLKVPYKNISFNFIHIIGLNCICHQNYTLRKLFYIFKWFLKKMSRSLSLPSLTNLSGKMCVPVSCTVY